MNVNSSTKGYPAHAISWYCHDHLPCLQLKTDSSRLQSCEIWHHVILDQHAASMFKVKMQCIIQASCKQG